jgi:hypothetical protein
MTLKFPNPFTGKPSKLELSGLFLFSPMIYFEIEGESISKIFKDLGKEPLLKKIESAKKEKLSKKRIDSIINEIQNDDNIAPNVKGIFSELVMIGIKEDEAGGLVPESIGNYAAIVKVINGSSAPQNISQRFLLEVEEKSKTAFLLASKKDLSAAGKAILEEEFFTPFLWNGMRNALNNVTSPELFLLLQISIAVEIFLATMIIRECDYENKIGQLDTKSFLDIWPIQNQKTKNPFGRLFDWTKQEAKVNSIPKFLAHPNLVEVDMDQLRLKRWSNGSHQPQREWLWEISKHLWGDSYYAPFVVRLGMAQYANFLGHFMQTIISKIPADLPEELKQALYPWPNFPHDHSDFSSWGRSRYQFWRDFARDYQSKTE